ncbi:hypothetical protein HU200_006939 [Digitaria exilis]|uniref:Uncharacterized protein n=1 Tax=Digitaria exilis TaxID=1010633 RepID=A0A835KSY9_9POAL|nr:hypothetical protein HU200_006939 [Digitaria exilis]
MKAIKGVLHPQEKLEKPPKSDGRRPVFANSLSRLAACLADSLSLSLSLSLVCSSPLGLYLSALSETPTLNWRTLALGAAARRHRRQHQTEGPWNAAQLSSHSEEGSRVVEVEDSRGGDFLRQGGSTTPLPGFHCDRFEGFDGITASACWRISPAAVVLRPEMITSQYKLIGAGWACGAPARVYRGPDRIPLRHSNKCGPGRISLRHSNTECRSCGTWGTMTVISKLMEGFEGFGDIISVLVTGGGSTGRYNHIRSINFDLPLALSEVVVQAAY